MVFAQKLSAAMQELHLNQKQLADLTGCSRASISQYLSGKNTPDAEKQEEMAAAIGLPRDYFGGRRQERKQLPPEKKMQRMKVEDVARALRMTPETVRKGLIQKVFPWGYAIRTGEDRWLYLINGEKFLRYEMVDDRTGCVERADVEDIAKIMHTASGNLRKGLVQQVFPWGYAIRTGEGRFSYFVNARRFQKHEMQM